MKLLATTGGAQGIGRATAEHFAREGYAVSFCDTDAKAGAETLAELQRLGAKAAFRHADVSKHGEVRAWVDHTIAEFGVPTVLINNAGLKEHGDFFKVTVEDFDRIVAVNLRGVFLCTQEFARHMVKAGEGGCIIQIASTRAMQSEAGYEVYSATKGGIVSMMHALSQTLAEARIRVNAISPGWIEVDDWQRKDRAKTPHHTKAEKEQHAVGRIGVPQDVAAAALYIAEHAPFMTGSNLVIDGGMAAKMVYE